MIIKVYWFDLKSQLSVLVPILVFNLIYSTFFAELSIAVLVFVVVGLACVKAYCSKKSESKEHEWEMLLGDLEMEHSTHLPRIEREVNI